MNEKESFDKIHNDKDYRSEILINLNISLQRMGCFVANLEDVKEINEFKLAVVSLEVENEELRKENERLREENNKLREELEESRELEDPVLRAHKNFSEAISDIITPEAMIHARVSQEHKYGIPLDLESEGDK